MTEERPDYADADLDVLLAAAMDGMVDKLEAGFDPGAGLADVRARAAAHTRADVVPGTGSEERNTS
jgi:hypothetical protein